MASRSDPWAITCAKQASGGDRQHFLVGQIRVSKSQTGQDMLFSIIPSHSVVLGKRWRENVSEMSNPTAGKYGLS